MRSKFTVSSSAPRSAPPLSHRILRGLASDYLRNLAPSTRYFFLYSYRHFAEYLKLPARDWQEAARRLLAMGPRGAARHLVLYRRWLAARFSPDCARTYGQRFLSFSRYAHERGVIAWKLLHPNERKTRDDWNACPAAYRRRVEEWIVERKSRGVSPRTSPSEESILRQFGVYLRAKRLSHRSFGYNEASEWLKHLRLEGYNPRTIDSKLRVIRGFFRWLARNRYAVDRWTEEIPPVRVPFLLPVFLEETEMARLLRAAETSSDRAMLEFMYGTGCRVGELCRLNVDDLSLSERQVTLVGKGDRSRRVPMNGPAARAVRRYFPDRERSLERKWRNQDSEALFVNEKGIRRTVKWVSARVKALAEKAGIRKAVTAHTLRHTYATHLLDHGADLVTIKELLGHSSLTSTLVYTHMATSRVERVYRRTHPRA